MGIYPADETNTGYQNAPGYPGSLTSSAGVVPLASGTTYSFINFNTGVNNASYADGLGAHDVTFVGCRFGSNQIADANVYTVGNNITYRYCTFEPNTVPLGSEPAISNTSYQIAYLSSYQYGVNQNSTGPITMSHCRMWGYGNAVQIGASTVAKPFIIDRCLFQNPAADGGVYHTDGPGQLNNLTGINGVQVTNCTIIGLGNTNGLAMQAGSYDSMVVTGNYFAGYGFMVAYGTVTGNQTNCRFIGNIWGSDANLEPGGAVQPNGGPLYPGSVGSFAVSAVGQYGNYWYGNKMSTVAGTTWMAAGNNGLFWWPTDQNPANASSIIGHTADWEAAQQFPVPADQMTNSGGSAYSFVWERWPVRRNPVPRDRTGRPVLRKLPDRRSWT